MITQGPRRRRRNEAAQGSKSGLRREEFGLRAELGCDQIGAHHVAADAGAAAALGCEAVAVVVHQNTEGQRPAVYSTPVPPVLVCGRVALPRGAAPHFVILEAPRIEA